VRPFILNHFEYFLAENYKATKVLSKEDDVLAGNLSTEVTVLKRRYYRSCADLVEAIPRLALWPARSATFFLQELSPR
jgi:hypothetical protein